MRFTIGKLEPTCTHVYWEYFICMLVQRMSAVSVQRFSFKKFPLTLRITSIQQNRVSLVAPDVSIVVKSDFEVAEVFAEVEVLHDQDLAARGRDGRVGTNRLVDVGWGACKNYMDALSHLCPTFPS